MAQNVVEILVKSRNDTKAGFAQAKADAEAAGEAAGQGFMSRMAMKLAEAGGGTNGGNGILGLLSSGGAVGQASTFIGIGAALAPILAAVVVELVALASGFAAATAGLGAFAILAFPVFSQLKQDYTNLQTAQEGLQKAQDKYTLDPTKSNLKALQTAQLNLKAVQMGMSQDAGGAASGIMKLRTEFDKMSTAFQPTVFKIINDGLQGINAILPAILPMAQAFAGALDGLLKRFDKFAQSKAFHEWLDKFTKEIGPATTAIGNGFGKIVVAFGKLLTVMSSHDVVHAINIVMDAITGLIKGLTFAVKGWMHSWDQMTHDLANWQHDTSKFLKRAMGDLANWAQDVDNWVSKAIGWFKGFVAFIGRIPGDIAHALGSLADMLYSIGRNAILGLWHGAESVFGGLLHTAESWGHDIANAIGSPFGVHFSEPSEATKMIQVGRNISKGLAQGITAGRHEVGMALGSLGGAGGGGGGQLVVTGAGAPNFVAFLKMMWPALQLEVRTRGGGGPNSAQIALGQVH